MDQLNIADLSPIPSLLNYTINNVMPVPCHSNIVKPLYTSNNTSVPMHPNSIEQGRPTFSQAHSSKFQSIETIGVPRNFVWGGAKSSSAYIL